MNTLHTLFAALAVPFTKDGAISEKCLRSLVGFVLRQNISGLYVGGSTGEALLQNTEERERVLKFVRAETDHRTRLIGHVGSIGTREAAFLARTCKKEGYDAVSAIPPIYFPYSKEEIVRYYSTIAEAADGLPLIIYNIPAMSGVQFTTDDLRQLIEIPNVCGIKQTSLNLYQSEQLRRLYPDLVILNGFDEIFLPALSMGANGSIGSTFNIMGARYNTIWHLFRQGRNQEAFLEQSRCNDVIDALVKGGVFPSIKYILYAMGVIETPVCRAPLPSLPRAGRDALDSIARQLLTEVPD